MSEKPTMREALERAQTTLLAALLYLPQATGSMYRDTERTLAEVRAALAAEEESGWRSFWVLERQGAHGPEYWDGGHADQYGDIHHAAKFFDKDSVFWIVRPLIDKRFAGVDGESPRLVEHAYVSPAPSKDEP